MTYEKPEMFPVGTVEECTFGGNLVRAWYDQHTGYTGFRHGPSIEDSETGDTEIK